MIRAGRESTVINTQLEDGRAVCIRTIRPDDRELVRAAIARMSDRSRYLRFFSGAKEPPPWVIERLVDADGEHHLAWAAFDSEDPLKPAIGAVHAFLDNDHDGCAEFSAAVLDEFHGLGLGKLLTATILLEASEHGVQELVANVLSENSGARDFARSLGGEIVQLRDGVIEFHLSVEQAIERLRQQCEPPGLAQIFQELL